MIWRNRPYTTSPLAVTAALLLLICGCGQVMSHFLARRPSRPGTWTGRLVSVTTRSGDEEYPALALDVESGPRSLSAKDDALALPPDRDVVLLCRGQGIIDPEELPLPIGSRVKVRGTLRGGPPLKLVQRLDDSGGIMAGVRMTTQTRNPSLIIDIGGRAKPEPLRE